MFTVYLLAVIGFFALVWHGYQFASRRHPVRRLRAGQFREFLSVGGLREALKNVPDDMPLLYQRIEDVYFDQHGWEAHRLLWERTGAGDSLSDYVPVFSAYRHPEDAVFVLNAHY